MTTKTKIDKTAKADSTKNALLNEYLKGDQGTHSFIIFFPKGIADLNLVKVTFSDYDFEAYTGFNLGIHTTIIDKYDVLYIDGFTDRKQAMDYLKRLKQKPEVFDKAKLKDHKEYIIDDFNLKVLSKNKNLDSYDKFFKDNYID